MSWKLVMIVMIMAVGIVGWVGGVSLGYHYGLLQTESCVPIYVSQECPSQENYTQELIAPENFQNIQEEEVVIPYRSSIRPPPSLSCPDLESHECSVSGTGIVKSVLKECSDGRMHEVFC